MKYDMEKEVIWSCLAWGYFDQFLQLLSLFDYDYVDDFGVGKLFGKNSR